MSNLLLLIPILLPLIYGFINVIVPLKNEKVFKIVSLCVTILTSLIVWFFLLTMESKVAVLISFTEKLEVSFILDGLGKVFAGLVSILWPIALLYSYTYMKHTERRINYYSWYVLVYGVVLGIAFSANLITMYFFYELLTFTTLPIIIYSHTREALRAGRTYLYYSLSGSTLALAGIVIIAAKTGSTNFIYGGLFETSDTFTLIAFLLTFLGFGVKAAIFPFDKWLPLAGVAPTPTTALLHAVAVVKSGAFAIMRCIYYCFGANNLINTWAQYVSIAIACITIVYGSSMALKEQHFKRRMAYSTVSNLSYILLGACLCTPLGLVAALLHFIYHSISKIGIFFSAGAIIETSGANYVYELNGFGKKMPIIFIIYTICSLSIIGIPLTCGFVSKYYLIDNCFKSGNVMGVFGIIALIISAILTLIYTLSITVRAFARTPLDTYKHLYENTKEPEMGFLMTCAVFAVAAIVFGLSSSGLIDIIVSCLGGVL